MSPWPPARRRRRRGRGAIAGNNVERNYKTAVVGYRVHVRLDNGNTRTFERKSIGNLHVGDRVRLDANGFQPPEAGVRELAGRIRVGVGGWVYEPWRDNFYPAGLAHARELEYLSRRVTAIEINATYYRTQSAASFAKWRDATPDDFVFAVKATRYATNRRVLARGGRIDRALRRERADRARAQARADRLAVRDDEGVRRRRLRRLPEAAAGARRRDAAAPRRWRCAIRASWRAEYVALARRHGVATVFADSDDYPSFADVTGDFVYARLMRCESAQRDRLSGGGDRRLGRARADAGATAARPPGLPRVEAAAAPAPPRDVFMFFISGAKERAPAAAVATLAALGLSPPVA